MAQLGAGFLLGALLAGCLAPPQSQPTGVAEATPALTATPEPTFAPTIDWFPATSTPTPAPLPAGTPTPGASRQGIGEVLLADGFADPQAWQTGKSASGTVALDDGELTLAVSAARGNLFSLRSGLDLDNFYLEVTAEPNLCRGADAYGLLLRASGSANFYRFTLTCDNRLRLERVAKGVLTVVQDWTPRLGPPAPNRLAASVSGRRMSFFINDIAQFSFENADPAPGTVGVFAHSAGDTPLTVTFSDMVIRGVTAVPSGPAPATLSSRQTAKPTTSPLSTTNQP